MDSIITMLCEKSWRADDSRSVFKKEEKAITVKRIDGIGDVIAESPESKVIAECKGWNRTDDKGTRKLFNECIGQALATWDQEATPWVVFASTAWFAAQCRTAVALRRVQDAKLRFALVK